MAQSLYTHFDFMIEIIPYWKNHSLENISDIIDGIVYVEEWKDIPKYEGLYQISSFGRIKSFPKQWNFNRLFIMKLKKEQSGHITIWLWKNGIKESKLIHQIVALLWCENIYNKPIPHHVDHNPSNNFFKNLKWATYSENTLYAYEAGRHSQLGERNAYTKLKNEDVIQIFNSKDTRNEIAKKYDVTTDIIRYIKSGVSWSHITGKKYEKKPKKLTADQILSIRDSLENKYSLAEKFGVDESTIRYIKNGRRYSQITGIKYKSPQYS